MATYKRQMNRYTKLVEHIFLSKFKRGMKTVQFSRDDIVTAANNLGITIPKNLGDVLYSFRYRTPLPNSIKDKAPKGQSWIIRPKGRGHYSFELAGVTAIDANRTLSETEVPDATPGVISM